MQEEGRQATEQEAVESVPEAMMVPSLRLAGRAVPLRPTHFLALPLNSVPGLVDKARCIQQRLVEYDANLRQTCVDPASLHLTLGVMTLQDEHQIRCAFRELWQEALGFSLKKDKVH